MSSPRTLAALDRKSILVRVPRARDYPLVLTTSSENFQAGVRGLEKLFLFSASSLSLVYTNTCQIWRVWNCHLFSPRRGNSHILAGRLGSRSCSGWPLGPGPFGILACCRWVWKKKSEMRSLSQQRGKGAGAQWSTCWFDDQFSGSKLWQNEDFTGALNHTSKIHKRSTVAGNVNSKNKDTYTPVLKA